MRAEEFVERLERVRPAGPGKWMACCPAHDDRNPSLSVSQGDKAVLLECFAGCSKEDVAQAAGVAMSDLFDDDKPTAKTISAEYDYTDEDGKLLSQVVRFENPKDFRQRRPLSGGGWSWKLGNTRRVLYRLPKVIAAVAEGKTIVVVEGEKDVEALEAKGAVATCNPGGAGKWKAEYGDCLVGAKVIVVADRDTTGREHARKVGAMLGGKAQSVRLLEPPEAKDIAAHLAGGGTSDELVELAEPAGENPPPLEPLPPERIVDLLGQTVELLDRYIVLPGDHERVALALFVAHSYAIDGAHATPYMLVVSPEKRSGKSRLLSVLELAVARPWGVIGASEAAMFRKIAKDRPTLLLDEIDAIWGSYAERTEPLRAIINAGNRPGATVARCVGENKDVEDFPIYCAKVLAGIDSGHRIPDTIRDRSVTIHMQRKTGSEPVERFRHRVAKAETEKLREDFERWAAGICDRLLEADPVLPEDLDDRAAEAWEPLFAIADLAGGNWPAEAREAALALSGGEDRDETTTGTMLLAAVRVAFGEDDRVSTTGLLAAINQDEELPFGGWRDGKGLDGRLLAKLLKPYAIKPRTIKLAGGSTCKGYLREQFSEAWERWLSTTPDSAVTSVTAVTESEPVTGKPLEQAEVTPVTAVTHLDHQVTDGSGVTASAAEEAEAERLAEKFEVAV